MGKKEVAKETIQLSKLQIEYVPVDSIKPNQYNPNRQSEHEFELLLKSIKEDGFTQPIIVTRHDKVIVDGEHRWKAGKALGMTEIPVVFVDMTDVQRRVSTLRHNRARGTEDYELTANLLRDLEKLGAIGWVQDSLMLDDEELSQILKDTSIAEELGQVEEFSNAYVPSGFNTRNDENTTSSSTSAAQETAKERQIQIQKAKTQEERDMASKIVLKTITVNLAPAEYDIIIKAFDGKFTAEKLVELCKQKLGM